MFLWFLTQLSSYFVYDKASANDAMITQFSCSPVHIEPLVVPYDFSRDDSIQKYVNPMIWLIDEAYKPADLVSLDGYEYMVVRGNEWRLRKEAADALWSMASAFHQQFGKSMVVVSSFRGYEYQKKLLWWYKEKYGWRANTFSAKPWHSEHQLWLAVDLFNASTQWADGYKDFFSWLREHAHEYWWTQSYQKWVDVDGYVVEPWHWRYVWVELATYLYQHKMTLGEYVTFWNVWK